MKKVFASLLLISFVLGCMQNSSEQVDEIISATDSTLVNSDNIVAIENEPFDSARYRLKEYFQNPIDFYQVKREIDLLEMGTILPSEFMLPIDSGYHNYNYGAVKGLLRQSRGFNKFHPPVEELDNNHRILSFSTYKPWATAKDRYLTTDNEILVGMEIYIGHPVFGKSDFVEKKWQEIEVMFGTPDSTINDCYIYFENQRVLVFNTLGNHVVWFKYYRLNDFVFAINDLPKSLFSWK